MQEALQPKRNEKGEPLKWAAVCCDAAEGKLPGDPVFLAWVRLASTPVRQHEPKVRAKPIEDRVVWVIDLFARLERRDQMLRSRV